MKHAVLADLLVHSLGVVPPSKDCDVQSMLIWLFNVYKEVWDLSGWQHYTHIKSLSPVLPMKILIFTTHWHLPEV